MNCIHGVDEQEHCKKCNIKLKNNMKYFLITVCTHDSEHEYHHKFLTTNKTNLSNKQAEKLIKECYNTGDYRIHEHYDTQELPESEYTIVSKYLHTHNLESKLICECDECKKDITKYEYNKNKGFCNSCNQIYKQ